MAQPLKQYSLVSLMNGQADFITDSNTTISLPFWGFGYNNSNPSIVLPGPTIYANEGDSVHVEMINPSLEGHTVHFHGLDVDQANDGVPHTSDFVLTNQAFTYRFKASHAGNFLYHCHVTTTLHLAMGMYGMVIVYPADSSNRVYTNGPSYDRQYAYLLSDLDSRWNADYTAIGSFTSYAPDLFLINGKNRHLLYEDTNVRVHGEVGEKHLLRFMNVGYRVNRVIFPSEIAAVVHTSDGRVLAQAFQSDTLIIYPGERYSVLAEILDDSPSRLSIDYLDPYRLRFLGREYIPINDSNFIYMAPVIEDEMTDTLGVGIGTPMPEAELSLFPNPARDEIWVQSATGNITRITIYDISGREVGSFKANNTITRVDVARLDESVYVLLIERQDGNRTTRSFLVQR
ncbi:MAG: multicopper oxidase domain-containing protein [Cryomorphaceae bacterium]